MRIIAVLWSSSTRKGLVIHNPIRKGLVSEIATFIWNCGYDKKDGCRLSDTFYESHFFKLNNKHLVVPKINFNSTASMIIINLFLQHNGGKSLSSSEEEELQNEVEEDLEKLYYQIIMKEKENGL